jgi:hypothetical protein
VTAHPTITGSASAEDVLALRRLAEEYAAAADRRDAEAFCAVFDPDDGRLVARREIRGIEGARAVMQALDRYARTFHFVGNARYEVEGERARGEVYCTASHLTVTDDGCTNYVMHIRYQDRYVRRDDSPGPGGVPWRILERVVVVDWTHTVPAGEPGAW